MVGYLLSQGASTDEAYNQLGSIVSRHRIHNHLTDEWLQRYRRIYNALETQRFIMGMYERAFSENSTAENYLSRVPPELLYSIADYTTYGNLVLDAGQRLGMAEHEESGCLSND